MELSSAQLRLREVRTVFAVPQLAMGETGVHGLDPTGDRGVDWD